MRSPLAWLQTCGPRALRAAARADGWPAPALAALVRLADVDRHGASLFGLRRAAQALGFPAGGWRSDYESLGSLTRPFIAHLTCGHWIAVRACGAETVQLAAGGSMRREEFERQWSRAILTLYPPLKGKEHADAVA